jgi:agmatine deiminase
VSDTTTDEWRQPPEWAPHDACWVAWPSAAELWQNQLGPAQRAFVAMCTAIADVDPEAGTARGERLEVLVPDEARAREAGRALSLLGARLHVVPYGDIWLRDIAPIFVLHGGSVGARIFGFNGWGAKYVLPHDDEVAGRIAAITALPQRRFAWVLEGGSVDVDGSGTCLTTRQCLRNANRNPSMNAAEIERGLCDALGVSRVLWLDEGLANDHTDGHVDTIARFVREGVVVCMEPRTPDDPNAGVLRTIARDLAAMTDARARRLEVVRVPSPGRVVGDDGSVMPASYVNFYIGNRAVVVPTYGAPFDDEAVQVIARLFPGRRTVGVDARAILAGGGAFHCITQQQPSPSPRRSEAAP